MDKMGRMIGVCVAQVAAISLLIGIAGAASHVTASAAGTAPPLRVAQAAEGPAPAGSSFAQQLQQGESALQGGNATQALASAEGAVLSDPERWEGYGLAGRALLAMQRYEAAADAFSKAIERAPEGQQSALRTLRRQTLLAEAGEAPASQAVPSSSAPPAVAVVPPASDAPQVPARRAGRSQPLLATDTIWIDDASGLMWARPWRYPTQAAGPWNYQQAQGFCGQLKLLGYADWRLPSIDELQRIYLPSSARWAWAEPSFEPAYGMEEALRRGVWRIGTFTAGGDTFSGGRLLIWSSTPGANAGTHAAMFFGRRYDADDALSVGTHLNGVRGRTPYRAYGLCVRTGADVNAAR